MTCLHPIAAATAAQTTPVADLARPMDTLTKAASGPACAPSALPQPETGISGPIIASRCKRLRFRSNEERKRYLSVHRALATYSAGDA